MPVTSILVKAILLAIATFAFMAALSVRAAPSSHLWSRNSGDGEFQWGNSVAADGQENALLAGYFRGTMNLGGSTLTSAGGIDVFLAKFDSSGNHLWSKSFGDVGDQYAMTVAVDGSGNAYLTGYLEGSTDFGGGVLTSAGGQDIFVAKFDSDGNHSWSKHFGGADQQYGQSIALDGAGNVLLTGFFSGVVDVGGGPLTTEGSPGYYDVLLAKFDTDGNHVWSKDFGDASDQYGLTIGLEPSGNSYVSGYFEGSIDFGGGTLTSGGGQDIFLAKFDSSGNYLWSQRFGDSLNQQGASVAVDGAGNAHLTGHFSGSVNFGGGQLTSVGVAEEVFLAKFDGAGNHLWSKRFGDTSDQRGHGVAVNMVGNVVVTGWFDGSIDFGGGALPNSGGPSGGQDIFVAELDSTGGHLWSKRFGDTTFQFGESVAFDARGDVLLAGEFYGSVDFGGGVLSSGGGSDVFLAKFEGCHDDSDCDGMSNSQESVHACLDLFSPDANADPDADALNNITELGLGTDPCVTDTDTDTCADGEETGPSQSLGGQRDPLSAWDFFDVPLPALTVGDPTGTRNKAVTLSDALAIVYYAGAADNGPPNINGVDYDSDLNGNGVEDGREYDRTPSVVPGQPWRSGAPNGAVTLADALVAVNQVGHSCAAAP